MSPRIRGEIQLAERLVRRAGTLGPRSVCGGPGTAQIRAQIAGAKPSGFTITRTAPVSVRGDIAVTQSNAAASVAGLHWRGIDVFQLRDGKIAREWDFELGATPPFDNGVPTG